MPPVTGSKRQAREEFRRLDPFDICVENGKLAVRDALSQFLHALRPLNLSADDKGTIELVLAEVLNNIVEHAYPPSASGGVIKIHCVHQSDGLAVQIKDEGREMPRGQLPSGELASLEVEMDDMPEGGFGWFLIQNLAKEVSYARIGDENQIKMRLVVGCTA